MSLENRIEKHGIYWMNSGHPTRSRSNIFDYWTDTDTITISDWGLHNQNQQLTQSRFKDSEGQIDRDTVREALLQTENFDQAEGASATRSAGQAAGSLMRFCNDWGAGTPVLTNLPNDKFAVCIIEGQWTFDEDHLVRDEDPDHLYSRPVRWLKFDDGLQKFDRKILPQSLHNIPDLTNAEIGESRVQDMLDMEKVFSYLR